MTPAAPLLSLAETQDCPAEIQDRAASIYDTQRQAIYRRTDKLFALLMALQWAGAFLAACVLSPRTWTGTLSTVHPHIWAAVFLGGVISSLPIFLALTQPGRQTTRQVIAVAQLLMSALLIHLSGGQATTHFHIFGSLAFLAFYRDWRVLATATAVTAVDHLVRGAFWPESVYGIAQASPWLTAQHVWWVAFEDTFLLISCRQSLGEMHQISLRQAQLEVAEGILVQSNEVLETQVAERTQELSEALQEHRNVMETVPDILFRLDMSGCLVQWNRRMEIVTGLLPEALQGCPAVSFFGAEEREKITQALAQAFKDGYVEVEGGLLGTSGLPVAHQFSAVPICGADGLPTGLTGMGRDITERRRTEEALRKSDARYQRIAGNLPGMVFQCVVYPDLSLTFSYVSEGCRAIYDAEPKEIVADPSLITANVHPEDQKAFAASLAAVVADQAPWSWEGRIVTKAGKVKWISGHSNAERQPNGDTVCEGQLQDVTERWAARTALYESEVRYRSLVEHSPEAVVVYSDSQIVYANDAAARLFAAPRPDNLLGLPIFDLIHPDCHPLVRTRAMRTQEQGKQNPLIEQKYMCLDGTVIDVEVVSTSVTYLGKPAGQAQIRDITHRKKTEKAIFGLNQEIVQAYDATIEGWSRALDLRDHETEGHSRRVTDMTLRLAQRVGLSSSELVHIKRGALLHDIGKMGVPDSILLKPGPLDTTEWEIMRRHPVLAKEMLDPAEFLRPALDIPYCHHEKWDGTGYPQGLSGEEIPLAARLFALVDVWDALSSDRPYRAAWPLERVKDHLHRLAGTHFDPDLVSVFLSLLTEGSFVAKAEPTALRAA